MSSVDTREVERDSLLMMAELTTLGEPTTKIKVRNLSEGGMMGEGALSLQPGQKIVVSLRNVGLVTGRVAWVRTPKFGVRFDHPVDPKLARTQVYGGEREAPFYARPAVAAPRHDGWNGKLRRV